LLKKDVRVRMFEDAPADAGGWGRHAGDTEKDVIWPKKGTILVVDNESDQLEMMKEILMRIGFDVKTTDNPQQALKMVENHAFRLILLISSCLRSMERTFANRSSRFGRRFAFTPIPAMRTFIAPSGWRGPGFDGAIGKPATMRELNAALSRTGDNQAAS
jgi:hypothetical protein